jgi:hypothetical protein
MNVHLKHISAWWYTYPSEKYEFVSWDYHSILWKVKKFMFQTTIGKPKKIQNFHPSGHPGGPLECALASMRKLSPWISCPQSIAAQKDPILKYWTFSLKTDGFFLELLWQNSSKSWQKETVFLHLVTIHKAVLRGRLPWHSLQPS